MTGIVVWAFIAFSSALKFEHCPRQKHPCSAAILQNGASLCPLSEHFLGKAR
jgi:hypothetical protein